MKQFNNTQTPAMQASLRKGVHNMIFPIEFPDDYDETVHWMIVSEPSNIPSSLAAIRSADEISLVPAVFEGTAHELFGLHPECVLALFEEQSDTAWGEVISCSAPAPVAPEPAELEEKEDGADSADIVEPEGETVDED